MAENVNNTIYTFTHSFVWLHGNSKLVQALNKAKLTITLKLYVSFLSRSNELCNVMDPVELLIMNVLESTETIKDFTYTNI